MAHAQHCPASRAYDLGSPGSAYLLGSVLPHLRRTIAMLVNFWLFVFKILKTRKAHTVDQGSAYLYFREMARREAAEREHTQVAGV
jgi:hypothetical protein